MVYHDVLKVYQVEGNIVGEANVVVVNGDVPYLHISKHALLGLPLSSIVINCWGIRIVLADLKNVNTVLFLMRINRGGRKIIHF